MENRMDSKLDVLNYKQMDGLRVFLNTLDYRTPHFHKELEILLILDGDLEILSERFHLSAGRGDMVLCNSGEAHELRKRTKSCTILYYHVAPSLLLGEVSEFEQIRFTEPSLQGGLPPAVAQECRALLLDAALSYLTQPPYYQLHCVGKMKELVYLCLANLPHKVLTEDVCQQRGSQKQRLQRLLHFVEENYMHKIRLGDFAQQEGMAVSSLSHFFKKLTHQSFQQYVNTVRFHAACRLLAAGQDKLLDICYNAGFSDYKYFSAAFLQRTGMTPEVYRQRIQEPQKDLLDEHQSSKTFFTLHSVEHFYTPQESVRRIRQYQQEEAGLFAAGK